MMEEWIKKPLLVFTLISGLSFLIYFNSLHGSFHFDDATSIINNSSIHLKHLTLNELKKATRSNRPVTDLSFAINYYFGDLDTLGYHSVNVAVHALTGFAVYLLLLEIFRHVSPVLPLFGSLLWISHPVQTQAVTYIVQRATSLSTLFFVLSLLFYIWGQSWTGKKHLYAYAASIGCGLLAVGSKEIAATLPVVLLIYEYYFGCNFDVQLFKKRLVKALPVILCILSVLIIYIMIILSSGEGGLSGLLGVFKHNYTTEYYPWWERLLTEFRVVVFYFSLLLFPLPSRLNIEHNFPLSTSLFTPVSTLFSLLTLMALIILAFRKAKVYPVLSFGIFWFFITTALESFIFRLDLVFEHRLYLPLIGFIIVICFFLDKIVRSTKLKYIRFAQQLVFGVCTVTLLLLSLWTIQRNSFWQDEITLWQDAIQKSPNSTRAINNLGLAYLSKGEYDQAAQKFQQAFVLAPQTFIFYDNLFIVYENQGKLDLALELVKDLIRTDPRNANAYYYLGKVMDRKGEYSKAKQALRLSIDLEPRQGRARAVLGNIHLKLGELEEAKQVYEALLKQLGDKPFEAGQVYQLARPKYIPDKPVVHYNLGQVYEKLGRFDDATAQYQEAIRIVPDFVPVQLDLARLYTQQRRFGQAIEQYRKVLDDDPSVIEAHFYLAFAYEMNRDAKNAVIHYREFLNLASKDSVYESERLMASAWLKKLNAGEIDVPALEQNMEITH